MRIPDMNELMAAYALKKMDPAPYYWFTEQRKYGTCEHGGYGLGVEVRALVFILPFSLMQFFAALSGVDSQQELSPVCKCV